MVKFDDPTRFKSLADNVLESKPDSNWVLYEMMPVHQHKAFEKPSDDLRKWLEDRHLDEHLKDGEVGADGTKFIRPLRDYLTIFRACEMYRTLFADRMASATRDLSYLKAASDDAKAQEAVAGKG